MRCRRHRIALHVRGVFSGLRKTGRLESSSFAFEQSTTEACQIDDRYGFYLDKDDHTAVQDDQVHLSRRAPVIAFNDPVSFLRRYRSAAFSPSLPSTCRRLFTFASAPKELNVHRRSRCKRRRFASSIPASGPKRRNAARCATQLYPLCLAKVALLSISTIIASPPPSLESTLRQWQTQLISLDNGSLLQPRFARHRLYPEEFRRDFLVPIDEETVWNWRKAFNALPIASRLALRILMRSISSTSTTPSPQVRAFCLIMGTNVSR